MSSRSNGCELRYSNCTLDRETGCADKAGVRLDGHDHMTQMMFHSRNTKVSPSQQRGPKFSHSLEREENALG